jgi:hypothetical protein
MEAGGSSASEASLAAVLREELQYLSEYRASVGGGEVVVPPEGAPLEDCTARLHDAGAAALCLSGGGIRSATFNLGVLQGLAQKGLLERFDYLSTVSGGGYIGGWLSAWAYRAGGVRAVAESLRAYSDGGERRVPQPRTPPHPIDWLRDYSHYLTPRAGVASLDTWTVLVTIARNLAVNWMALVPVLMLALLVPVLTTGMLENLGETSARWRDYLTVGACVIAVLLVLRAVAESHRIVREDDARGFAGYFWRVNFPFLAGLLVLASLWAIAPRGLDVASRVPQYALYACAIGGALLGFVQLRLNPALRTATRGAVRRFVAGALLSLVIALLALGALFSLTSDPALWMVQKRNWWPIIVLPPLVLAALLCGDLVYAAFTSRYTGDPDRERWARSGAWFAIAAIGWTAWTAIAMLSPVFFFGGGAQRGFWAEPGFWSTLGTTVLGVVLARFGSSTATAAQAPAASARTRWLLPLAIGAFVLGVLVLLAAANFVLLHFLKEAARKSDLAGWTSLAMGAGALALLLGFVYLVWRLVNVNVFSLHAMYRDRLVRAYLGAARDLEQRPLQDAGVPVLQPPEAFERFEADRAYIARWVAQWDPRRPNPFTGFDDADNPDLFWLGLPGARRQPLWIVNMALNLVEGAEHLGWQERKAASFTASPLHCGSWITGYRPTIDYGSPQGGISAGTAIAISGAAANPNMGYHSSPALTFLMTFMNVRLGWWLGNPLTRDTPGKRDAPYRMRAPLYGIWQIFRELLGQTNATSDWLHLSDGGHFDNLGLYEMALRRCRFIVVCDASADEARSIADFGRAIRQVRADLGVDVRHAGGADWRIGARALAGGAGHALFDLHYPEGRRGRLLYVKPSLYDDDAALPRDVWQYAQACPAFPHESTVDQFFSESQFESYRALGEYQVRERVFPDVHPARFDGWQAEFDHAHWRLTLGNAAIVHPPRAAAGLR